MAKKPTIYDIKFATEAKAPFYFARKTMRGFGQTMKSFSVIVSPKGNIFIAAPSYMGRDGKRIIGYSVRQFTGDDLKLLPVYSVGHDFTPYREYIEAN